MDTTLTFILTLNSCVVLHTLMQKSFGIWFGVYVLSISSSQFSFFFGRWLFLVWFHAFFLLFITRKDNNASSHSQLRMCKGRNYPSRNPRYSNPQRSTTGTIYIEVLHVPAPINVGSIQNNTYTGIWDKTKGHWRHSRINHYKTLSNTIRIYVANEGP